MTRAPKATIVLPKGHGGLNPAPIPPPDRAPEGRAKPHYQTAQAMRWLNRSFAAIFAALAVRLALERA